MMKMAGFTVALMVIAVTITIYVDGNESSNHREVKILRHLKRLNKPGLKYIEVSYTNFMSKNYRNMNSILLGFNLFLTE